MTIKERVLSAAVFVPVAIMVTVLAFVQYHWSSQVSEATSLRLADSLQMSIVNWHRDLLRDFSQICFISALDSRDGAPSDPLRYAPLLADWRAASIYPNLISNLYVARDGGNGVDLLRYDSSASRFGMIAWPANFQTLRTQLMQFRSDDITSGQADSITPIRAMTRNTFHLNGPPNGWEFEPTIPALIRPIITGTGHARHAEWIVVELNIDVIRNKVLPDLARRYFRGTDGLDFQLAVISGNPDRVIYSSDGGFGDQTITDADGTLNVFGRPRANPAVPLVHVFHKTSEDAGPVSAAVDVSWFPLLSDEAEAQDWHLFVRHRRGGPLGTLAVELRHRDLALSFGILALLVASMGMLLVTTRRAQSLAKLQMDFVTTVSHELRTPLTVISSAADNIAQGVVNGREQLSQYGSLIQTQTHRLSGLVEQVLLFAAMRQERQWYAFRPVEVSEIINAALVHSPEISGSSQFIIEQDIEPNLPLILGDVELLSQCVQNLISNAMKYGGSEKWLGISARYDTTTGEIEINVADHGLGIAAEDVPHIFEPFYRSHSVVLANVRGTGIGLALAKNIAELMNGRLTLSSSPDRGSTFILRLPRMSASEVTANPAPPPRGTAEIPGKS